MPKHTGKYSMVQRISRAIKRLKNPTTVKELSETLGITYGNARSWIRELSCEFPIGEVGKVDTGAKRYATQYQIIGKI